MEALQIYNQDGLFVILDFQLSYQNSNFSNDVIFLDREEILIFLSHKDFIDTRWSDWTNNTRSVSVAELVGCGIDAFNITGTQYQLYKQAMDELDSTGKIEGCEIFCVNQNKKVWIAKNEWEFLINEKIIRAVK
jgi:hypothetical protein